MWSRVVTYGMWWKIEGFFSGFKLIFREGVQATSWEGIVREIRMKVDCYSRMLALAGRQHYRSLVNLDTIRLYIGDTKDRIRLGCL